MSKLEKDVVKENSEMKKDQVGESYIEQADPAEDLRRKLHPKTGTEADQPWEQKKTNKEPAPLLDLELAWCQLADAVPIDVSEQEPTIKGDSVEVCNAALMARELKYYLMASVATEKEKEEKSGDNGGAEWNAPIPKTAMDVDQDGNVVLPSEPVKEEEEVEGSKSVYGASILLKLQWGDRSVQKHVPRFSYVELAGFLYDLNFNLSAALDTNPAVAQVALDTIAFELTPLVLVRYLDGIETETASLEENSLCLLKLFSTRANPKEMHVSIKSFLTKIDGVYMDATSYLCLKLLIELWGDLIPRIEKKRRPFVMDFIKQWNKMHPCAEAFNTAFVPTGGVGVERPGRIAGLAECLLHFLESLIAAQLKQRHSDSNIQVEVDELSRLSLNVNATVPSNSDQGKSENDEPKFQKTDMTGLSEETALNVKEMVSAAQETTLDWVLERAITLAKLLEVLGMLWMKHPIPSGEDRDVPRKKLKKSKKKSKIVDASIIEKELTLSRCLGLFASLGWSNPAVVCQLSANGLALEHADRDGELMENHIGHEKWSSKQRKYSLFSLPSVGIYLCGILRQLSNSKKESGNEVDDKDVIDLSGSVFDLLDPHYALDLVLQFLLPLLHYSAVSVSIRAIMVLRAFISRLPANAFISFDDLLRLRSGSGTAGREANILGALYQLLRAIESFDDPKHRRIAYETVQAILKKCSNPTARYVMTECLYYSIRRNVVGGQMMTELKSAIMYSETLAENVNVSEWNVKQASKLRWRFAEDCFSRCFTPRKELLSFTNQIATASALMFFLVTKDVKLSTQVGEADADLQEEIKKRKRFCKVYGRLGRECIRALASVAEHDRQNIPKSALAKHNAEDALAVFQASGRTLNECIGAISFLDSVLEQI